MEKNSGKAYIITKKISGEKVSIEYNPNNKKFLFKREFTPDVDEDGYEKEPSVAALQCPSSMSGKAKYTFFYEGEKAATGKVKIAKYGPYTNISLSIYTFEGAPKQLINAYAKLANASLRSLVVGIAKVLTKTINTPIYNIGFDSFHQ